MKVWLTSRLALFLVLVLLLSACDRPLVGTMGVPVDAGSVQVSVTGYEVRLLELQDGAETIEYDRPVLAVSVTLENKGPQALAYSPAHATQQMSELTTPLLYLDPGAEAKLPPAAKTIINGVYLPKGTLEGQVTGSVSVAAGQRLTDVFLFEVPDTSATSLVLSLPPTMHASPMPVLVRIPYTPQVPKGPVIHTLGSPITVGSATLSVQGAELAYIKLEDSAKAEGYSTEPLVKIAYTLANAGTEPLVFDPGHRDIGQTRGAALMFGDSAFRRARFAGNISPVGQLKGSPRVAPGQSVQDFLLFEMPTVQADHLLLEFPASSFGQAGILRVRMPFDLKVPAKPKELEVPAK